MAKVTRAYEGNLELAPGQHKHIIWLGDFNRHHPRWDKPSDTRLFTQEALTSAEKLIGLVANAGLDLALPPQKPTHKHNVTKKWTRLDQVFISDHSLDALTACDTVQDSPGICTDHIPILTELNMPLSRALTKTIENFREVDWDKFRAELRTQLNFLGNPRRIDDQQRLDTECSGITDAIQNVIAVQVPKSEISPKSKRWWSKELTSRKFKAT